MVRHEYDPAIINDIANRAEVRPMIDHIYADGPLDLSAAVGWATQTNIVWLSNGDDAAAAFELVDDRIWNGHLMFAATCRGRRGIDTGREMLAWMSRYADEIWGLVPVANRAARWFARKLGFAADSRRDDPVMGACEALVWRPV